MSLIVIVFLIAAGVCVLLGLIPPNRAYRHYYLWSALALLVCAIALYLWLPMLLDSLRG